MIGNRKEPAVASERASERARERASERASERESERARERESERARERESERASVCRTSMSGSLQQMVGPSIAMALSFVSLRTSLLGAKKNRWLHGEARDKCWRLSPGSASSKLTKNARIANENINTKKYRWKKSETNLASWFGSWAIQYSSGFLIFELVSILEIEP